jgi:hypothetical protein
MLDSKFPDTVFYEILGQNNHRFLALVRPIGWICIRHYLRWVLFLVWWGVEIFIIIQNNDKAYRFEFSSVYPRHGPNGIRSGSGGVEHPDDVPDIFGYISLGMY